MNFGRIICLSLNLENIPIKKLGDFTFKDIKKVLTKLKKIKSVEEGFIIQKCNSIDIFVIVNKDYIHNNKLLDFWKKNAINFIETYTNKIKTFLGKEAIKHLFKSSVGLKSVLLGDSQVLGQILNSYKLAKGKHLGGPYLDQIIKNIKILNIKLEKNTSFKKGYTSIERFAAEILNKISSKEDHILVYGLGRMGSLIVKALFEMGFKKLILCNKSFPRAKSLAKKYNFEALTDKERLTKLKNCEIYIDCSYSPSINVKKKDLGASTKLLVDLGNPPNITEKIRKVKGVKLINLDDIRKATNKTLSLRKKEIPKVKKFLEKQMLQVINDLSKLHLKKTREYMKNKVLKNIFGKKIKIITRIRSKALFYIREFLLKKDFTEIHTPKIVMVHTDPVKSEREFFDVRWYDKRLFLTQSSQLHKQIAILSGFNKIFEIGPFYRKEETHYRHLSEAYSLDVEFSNVRSHHNVMGLLEHLIIYVLKSLKKKDNALLKELGVTVKIPTKKFTVITYDKTVKLLKKNKIKMPYGEDIGYIREDKLFNILFRNKICEEFVFIEKYPRTIKKFYTKSCVGNKLTKTFDLLYNGWEIASGAQRETKRKLIEKRLLKANLDLKKFKFYLDFFKGRIPEHGGFGLGIDRFITKLLSLESIDNSILFPRHKDKIIP